MAALRRSRRVFLLLLVLILTLSACSGPGTSSGGASDGEADGESPSAGPAETPPAAGGSHLFNAEQVQVGDEVAGMRVEGVSAYGDPGQPPDLEFPSVTVRFSGQVTVAGRFEHFPPGDEFLPGVVCFFPDDAGAARLPRMESDERDVWFCFDNVDEARQVFGGPGAGTATVTVDAYTIHYYPSEVFNTAVLLEAAGIQR